VASGCDDAGEGKAEQEARKGGGEWDGPEHVAVQVLPARLIAVVARLVVAGVLQEVVLQHPQQDGGQEAGEQQDGDAGVDDGEPVDL
jgi:hypothetical protein